MNYKIKVLKNAEVEIKNMINRELAKIREYKVVKSNRIIQKSRYELSTQEQKIILYLITKIKPGDTEFNLYEFKIVEFCKVCGIDKGNGKNYIDLKRTIKELADKSIWITLDNGTETLIRWIERPFIDRKSGTIKIKLDEFMRPYLLQLKECFTSYDLYFTLAMKSKYSIRIYELLKSYEYLSGCTIELEELKKFINAEKYTTYKDFRVNVLDVSLNEINEYGDIDVTYEVEKQGRKVHKIIFKIKLKTDIIERVHTFKKIENRINPKNK